MSNIDFDKANGLMPAIIQDHVTGKVLMLGYMNEASLEQTRQSGKVTFYSRSKKRLWTKGESSGNFLLVKDIKADCDGDALLIKAFPEGPVCHRGTDTCWGEDNKPSSLSVLDDLEKIIEERKEQAPQNSYTAKLFDKGLNRIAQKLGEEAVELIIAAKDNNEEEFLGEAADLLYHFLVLLRAKETCLTDVGAVLKKRMKV